MGKPTALFSGWGTEAKVRNPGDDLCHQGAKLALQTSGLTGVVDVRNSIQPVTKPWKHNLVIGGGTVLPTVFMSHVGPGLRHAENIFIFGSGCLSKQDLITKSLINQVDREPYSRAVVIGLRGPLSCRHYESFFGQKAKPIGDLGFMFAAQRPFTTPKKTVAFFMIENERRDSRIQASFQSVNQSFRELAKTVQEKGADAILCHSDRSGKYLDEHGLSKGMTQLRKFRNAHELVSAVQSASMVVTERLHPAIIACCSGIPFLCIRTTSKMEDLKLLLQHHASSSEIMSEMFAGMRDDIRSKMALVEKTTELPEILVAIALKIKASLLEAASQLAYELTGARV